MSDDDLLRGYRPVGPPPELRARIRSAKAAAERSTAKAAAERSSFRDWLPALAAAALIALFASLSDRAHAQIDARVAVPDDLRPVEQWVADDGGAR